MFYNRIYAFILIFLISYIAICNKMDNQSINYKSIIDKADKLTIKMKYSDAISLYEYLYSLTIGTDLFSEVIYKLAFANFKFKKYSLAGEQFKKFYTSFNQHPKAENALYLYTLCCYSKSNEYNLDPTNTKNAINELKNFIYKYPNSNKINSCKFFLKELEEKLAKKEFNNALTLYKINKYKSAVIAFFNMISDFPNSKFKEDAYYYSILSKYKLAKNSIPELKKERIIQVKNFINLFFNQFPNSHFKKKIIKIEFKVNTLLSKYNIELKDN